MRRQAVASRTLTVDRAWLESLLLDEIGSRWLPSALITRFPACALLIVSQVPGKRHEE